MADEGPYSKRKPAVNGIVLYPRSYHIDENDSSGSYIHGVTQGGSLIVLYLSLKEEDKQNAKSDESKTLPSISAFSQKRPSSPTRCEASVDNSVDSPKGVLLAEQVSRIKDESVCSLHPGIPVFQARWVSILQQDDYLPSRISIGYIEVGFSKRVPQEVSQLIGRFRGLYNRSLDASGDQKLELDSELDSLQREIISNQKNFYKGVCIDHADIKEGYFSVLPAHFEGRKDWLKSTLREVVESRTYKGMYGAAFIRLRKGDQVSPLYCSKMEMRYDFASSCVKDFESTFENWARYDDGGVLGVLKKIPANGDMVLEIVPAQQINLGVRSYDRYNKDLLRLSSSKYAKTFVDSDFHRFIGISDIGKGLGYLCAHIAIRTAETVNTQEGNILMSAFHAYSAPVGSPYLIDRDGGFLSFSDSAKNSKSKAS